MKNFKIYKDQVIEIEAGVFSICGLNGSGKSTMLEAVLYAIYGYSRSGKVDLKRWGFEKEEMLVSLQMEFNNSMINIIRGLDKSSKPFLRFLIDTKEVTKDAINDTQIEIDRFFGVNFKIFCSSIIFTQKDNDDFLSGTSSNAKSYLTDILNYIYYDKLSDSANGKYKNVENKIIGLEAKQKVYKDLLSKLDYQKEYEKYKGYKKQIVDKEKILKIEKTGLEEIDDELLMFDERMKYYEFLEKEKNEILTPQNSNKIKIEYIEKDIEEINDKIKNLNVSISDLKTDLSLKELQAMKEEIKLLEASLITNTNKLNFLKKHDTCPTCQQSIKDKQFILQQALTFDETNSIELAKLNKTYDEEMRGYEAQKENKLIEFEIDSLEKELKPLEIELKKLEKNKKGSNDKLKQINLKLKEKPDISIRKGIEKRKDEIDNKIITIATEISLIKLNKKNLANKLKEYKENEVKFNEIKNKLLNLKKKKKYKEYSKIVQQVKTKLFVEAVEDIQDTANYWLSKLNDTDDKIVFSFKDDARDSFQVFINRNGKNHLYENFSPGECTKINLSVHLAFSEKINSMFGFEPDFLWLDEVFASVDEVGTEHVIQVMNVLSNEFRQIFLISHTDIKDRFGKKIEVKRYKDYAEVEVA